MELARNTSIGADISTEFEVLTYTYTGSKPIEVISRVDLGDTVNPIAGGASYLLSFYIDGVFISPESAIDIPVSKDRTIMNSRSIALESGDVVSIRIKGTLADTSVNIAATLRDSTPVLRSEVLGIGNINVDHDYPTTDNMRVITPEGAGIQNVDIKTYLTSDYNAGIRGVDAIRGQTKTDAEGRWSAPFDLGAGSYTFVFTGTGRLPALQVVEVS